MNIDELVEKEKLRLLVCMGKVSVTSDAYTDYLARLEALEKAFPTKAGIDASVVLGIIERVGTIVLILYWEQTNVLTSKAFGLLRKF